jgi:hypothetical protein
MFHNPEQLAIILQSCRKSRIGKMLPDALYVHFSALSALDPNIQEYEQSARALLSEELLITLIKF